jgi:hypothetical protein
MFYSEGPAPTHSKPWPNRNPCRETSGTPQGCFVRHLPQYSMRWKLPHDAIGMLNQISNRLENVELLDRHSAPMHPLTQTHEASCGHASFPLSIEGIV